MKKTFYLSIFFFLVCLSAKSQTWSPPQPFTYGESNKANAFLGNVYYFDFVLLWEQSTDSLSTAIYYQRYLTGDDPEVLISAPDVHYKNPSIVNAGYNLDTAFIVFRKITGDQSEIQYIKFATDGGHSQPINLSAGGNQNSLLTTSVETWSYDPYNVAWNSDGNLLISKLLHDDGYFGATEPDTLFSGEILDIKFKLPQIYWITTTADSAILMRSELDYGQSWTDPEEVYRAKNMDALRGTNHLMDDMVLAFSYANDETWHINNYSFWYNYSWFYPLELSSTKAFDFDVFSTFIGVDGDLQIYHLAYVKDTLGAHEIFINHDYFPQNFSRLSYLETTCRNPQFFLGENEYNYGNWCYMIFEAFVDGYWQLYYSRAPFTWGSIAEKPQIEGVSISPNPATDFIRIYNENLSDLNIEIFDMTGKRVYQDALNQIENEIKTAGWKRGVYFVTISQENKMITRKLVLF